MKDLIEKIKTTIRGIMTELAKLIDQMSNSFIHPWHITGLSFVGHVFVLLALTEGMFTEAAILLAGFGLLDALDGALARYQGTGTTWGMLLDSTSDRLKEAMVFGGLAFYFAENADPFGALLATLALGISVSVSYVKSKGEVAILEQGAKNKRKKEDINREFEEGVFGYEIRMFILVAAFLLNEPFIGVCIVTGGALLTFLTRFNSVVSRLDD